MATRTDEFLHNYRDWSASRLAEERPSGTALTALAIDGGGVRGLVPALVLAEIERRAQLPISQCFDVVSGTSTGGLLALGLTVPGADGTPRWSAEELVELYRSAGQTIFQRRLLRRLGSLLFDKYSPAGLERELRARLGEATISQALTDVIITAWNLSGNHPAYFDSAEAGRIYADRPMWQVARATSAAPTYFAPMWIPPREDPEAEAYVDGGVFANNPARVSYLALRQARGADRPLVLVSLGTGDPDPIDPRGRSMWGGLPWLRPMIEVFMVAPSELVDVGLRDSDDPGLRYHRLAPVLGDASPKLDNASRENIAALERDAADLIERHEQELDFICRQLATRGAAGAQA